LISATGTPNQRRAAGCTESASQRSSADTIGQASVAAGLISTGPAVPVYGVRGPSGAVTGRSGGR
jgi:hypothetical protein